MEIKHKGQIVGFGLDWPDGVSTGPAWWSLDWIGLMGFGLDWSDGFWTGLAWWVLDWTGLMGFGLDWPGEFWTGLVWWILDWTDLMGFGLGWPDHLKVNISWGTSAGKNGTTFLTKNAKYFGKFDDYWLGWGTTLQTERSRLRFPMVTLEIFIHIKLPATLWSWGPLSRFTYWLSWILGALIFWNPQGLSRTLEENLYFLITLLYGDSVGRVAQSV